MSTNRANRVFAQVKLDPKTGDFAGGMYTMGHACRTIELARLSPGLSSIGDATYPRGIISFDQDNFANSIVIEERLEMRPSLPGIALETE